MEEQTALQRIVSTKGTFLRMNPNSSGGSFDHEHVDGHFASVLAFHALLETFLLFLNLAPKIFLLFLKLSPMIDFVFYRLRISYLEFCF